MAIEYAFLDRGDEQLIKTSELPVEEGIAVAVRTTGYAVGTDEVLQMSIVDFNGHELFNQTVKPQNIDEWSDERASGGLTPADVQEAPELFQFEDEIIELFDKASIVVGQHIDFIVHTIETGWVSLPKTELYDLSEQFCASHSTVDYPGQAAAAVALSGIAGYYGISCDDSTTTGEAQAVATCYLKLVEEHARERLGKGSEHWKAYEQKKQQEELNDKQLQESKRIQEIKQLRISAFMWLCAAAIFSNLAVQLHIRAFDFGFVLVAAAAAVYFAVRWLMSMYSMFKLRKRD